jgi:hypothetical protein
VFFVDGESANGLIDELFNCLIEQSLIGNGWCLIEQGWW